MNSGTGTGPGPGFGNEICTSRSYYLGYGTDETLGQVATPKIKRRPYLGTGSGFVTQNGLVKVNSTRSESKKGQTLLNIKSIVSIEGT